MERQNEATTTMMMMICANYVYIEKEYTVSHQQIQHNFNAIEIEIATWVSENCFLTTHFHLAI